jgi:hypothetical protein
MDNAHPTACRRLTIHSDGDTSNCGIAVKECTKSRYIFGCLPDEFDLL